MKIYLTLLFACISFCFQIFGQAYPILFYSGRNGNQDIYIKYPGKQVMFLKDYREKTEIWITHHPDWDGWASFVPVTEEGEKQ